ncbi:hypothetical protein PE061_14115 [Sphingosinicella microcystinivorans]|nr:hypothetical protein [Sphingosinicella microcystinivorans]WBX82946.1 hypothetical protein PE061_14115 [Sphingosinicella microcystinivorans]
MDRVDLQLLLDLRAALLGVDHAIADRRAGAVPEALARILVHRPKRMLGGFLRLIFVEQRHDPPHHLARRIVAENLRDGDELHAILRQLADVELELELVTEEAREAMDDHHVESRRLLHRGIDHVLESGPTIVRSRDARFDELGRDLPAIREAIALELAALIGDRQIMVRLARRGNAQVERGAGRRHDGRCILLSLPDGAGHDVLLLTSWQGTEQRVQFLA